MSFTVRRSEMAVRCRGGCKMSGMWFRVRRRLTRDALVPIVAVFALAGRGAVVVGAVELPRTWEVGAPLMLLGVLMMSISLMAALTLGDRR